MALVHENESDTDVPPKGAAATRARIQRIAADLFTRNGYHATGVAEIATAVRLGRGALYYHIGSKENLLYEICGAHVYAMAEFGEGVLASDLDPESKFRELSTMLLRTISENRDELTVFFREINSLTGERRERLLEVRDRFEAIWEQILDDGIAKGVFRDVDPILVKGILGMHNYAYVWLRAEGPMSPESVSHIFSDVLLRGLLVQDAAV